MGNVGTLDSQFSILRRWHLLDALSIRDYIHPVRSKRYSNYSVHLFFYESQGCVCQADVSALKFGWYWRLFFNFEFQILVKLLGNISKKSNESNICGECRPDFVFRWFLRKLKITWKVITPSDKSWILSTTKEISCLNPDSL